MNLLEFAIVTMYMNTLFYNANQTINKTVIKAISNISVQIINLIDLLFTVNRKNMFICTSIERYNFSVRYLPTDPFFLGLYTVDLKNTYTPQKKIKSTL